MGAGDEKMGKLERQLATAQQITHIGSWEWDLRSGTISWSDELFRIYGLEPQSCAVTYESFLSRLHPDDRERLQREVQTAIEKGARFAYPERIIRPNGEIRELDTVGEVSRDEQGRAVALLGTCRDITEERRRDESLRRARALLEFEALVLEMIASGADLRDVLRTLVLAIEEHAPPAIGSILLLDDAGRHIRHGAAPHLPEAYVKAIDGLPVGPKAGSCGTAAYTRRPVLAVDIEKDPLWQDYRELTRPFGLRACWSTPIFAKSGRVIGTFAMYYREPRAPADADLELIERATHVAGIAIERAQLEEQLRALTAHLESVREDERAGIAREIHDVLGQALTAIKMDIAWVARRVAASSLGDVPDRLRSMSEATDEIIEAVRRISAELRPGVLDDLGLVAALEWQARDFEARTGTTCTVEASGVDDVELEPQITTAVFRICQEALTNVARHAHATSVEVTLARTHDGLELQVKDDGDGIDEDALYRPTSLGLLGIRERARRLGGWARVGPAEPRGTVVKLVLPIGPAAAKGAA
jgi:PAS domain S-box-containing protein